MFKFHDFYIQGLILREKEISPEEILFEIKKRYSFLKEHQYTKQTPLLIEAKAELNTIFWMYASFFYGTVFTPLPPQMTNNEEQRALAFFKGSKSIIKGEEQFSSFREDSFLPHQWQKNELMAYVFSSGSTGPSSPIGLSYDNFKCQALLHEKHNHQNHLDIWLASLPLYHVGGINIFTRGLFLNQKIAFDGPFHQEKYLFWLESSSITALSLVPTMLYRLMRDYPEIKLSKTIKMILVGGAFLNPGLKETALQKNWPIVETYGMTETCSQIYTNNSLLPEVFLKFSPEGEILIKSPTLAPGLERDHEGFYATGDLGHYEQEGNLKILGRKKNLINSGGIKISPEEVEATLLTHPYIEQVAVWGEEDIEWGEKLCAAYISSKHLKNDELILYLRERLSSQKIPKEFMQVKKIPQTSNGKIKRSALLRKNLI